MSFEATTYYTESVHFNSRKEADTLRSIKDDLATTRIKMRKLKLKNTDVNDTLEKILDKEMEISSRYNINSSGGKPILGNSFMMKRNTYNHKSVNLAHSGRKLTPNITSKSKYSDLDKKTKLDISKLESTCPLFLTKIVEDSNFRIMFQKYFDSNQGFKKKILERRYADILCQLMKCLIDYFSIKKSDLGKKYYKSKNNSFLSQQKFSLKKKKSNLSNLNMCFNSMVNPIEDHNKLKEKSSQSKLNSNSQFLTDTQLLNYSKKESETMLGSNDFANNLSTIEKVDTGFKDKNSDMAVEKKLKRQLEKCEIGNIKKREEKYLKEEKRKEEEKRREDLRREEIRREEIRREEMRREEIRKEEEVRLRKSENDNFDKNFFNKKRLNIIETRGNLISGSIQKEVETRARVPGNERKGIQMTVDISSKNDSVPRITVSRPAELRKPRKKNKSKKRGKSTGLFKKYESKKKRVSFSRKRTFERKESSLKRPKSEYLNLNKKEVRIKEKVRLRLEK